MNGLNLAFHLEHRVEPRGSRWQRGVQSPSLHGPGCSEQSPTSTTEPTAWSDQEFTD